MAGPPPMWSRRALLVPGIVALLVAAWVGLGRMGWSLPAMPPALVGQHGPLMVCGLFGTLIALERAVALGALWAFLGPLLGGAGTLFALVGLQRPSALAFSGAALLLLAASMAVVKKQSEVFTWVMALGAAAWLVGAALWAAGRPLYQAVPWWMAFLVLTISAERLELSRLVRPPLWARRVFPILVALLLAGVAFGVPRLLGAAMLLMAAWLARFDVAKRTVRMKGLPRFAASALLAGYFWLAVAGLLFAFWPPPVAGPLYDAALHAVFVGFVLSMVFAHAPIILPAVARLDIPFHPALFVPLAALHGSLVLRVAGDLLPHAELRRAGGMGNALTLLLFGAAVFFARSRRRAR